MDDELRLANSQLKRVTSEFDQSSIQLFVGWHKNSLTDSDPNFQKSIEIWSEKFFTFPVSDLGRKVLGKYCSA